MENVDKSKAKLCQAYYKVLGVRVDHYIAVSGMHGEAGLLFLAGNPSDLAAKVEWGWNHPEQLTRKGRAAPAEREAKYEPSKEYEILTQWYGRVRRG